MKRMQRGAEFVDIVRLLQRACRNVDRHRHANALARHGTGPRGHPPQHLLVEINNQHRALGNRNQLAIVVPLQVLRLPAYKRFESAHPPAHGINARLEVRLDQVVIQRIANRILQRLLGQ